MPPASSRRSRGIAKQAPETKPGSSSATSGPYGVHPSGHSTGAPAPPAHAIPVKWTTPPRVLTTRPPCAVTSPCQAAQPRPSTSGRSIASRKPGSGLASGLRKRRSAPLLAAAPRLDAVPNPRLAPVSITLAAGASSRTASAVPSSDALSTTISSSAGSSCAASGASARSTAARLWWVTTTTETELSAASALAPEPALADRLEDPGGVWESLAPGHLPVAEAIEPDDAGVEPPALAPAGEVDDDHHVLVVGAEDHLRLRLELREAGEQLIEDPAEAVGAAIAAAKGNGGWEDDLAVVGDAGGDPIQISPPERIPQRLDHLDVVAHAGLLLPSRRTLTRVPPRLQVAERAPIRARRAGSRRC